MKRNITVALAATLLLACTGLAYGSGGYFDDPTVTSNQRAIGEYFNDFFTPSFPPYGLYGDPTSDRIDAVYGEGTEIYLRALDNLSPETYAALPDVDLRSLEQFRSLTLGRLAALRSSGPVAREARPLLLADSGSIMLDAAPLLYTPATGAANGWGVWGEGFGLFGRQTYHDGKFGYDYETYGFSLGVDRTITDEIIVGLATGYSNSRVDFDDVYFNGKINSFDLGLYGSYNPGAWYLDASFSWSRNWHETDRFDLFAVDTAHAKYSGDAFAWYVGGGYNIDLGKARITPIASLTYTYYTQGRFSEEDAGLFNLVVNGFDSHSIISRAGLRFAYEFDLNGVTIVPEASAEWAHEYLDTDRTVVSRLVSVSDTMFEVDGIEADRDSAILGLGVSAYFGNGFSLYADYNTELRKHYDSHGFMLGVRYEF